MKFTLVRMARVSAACGSIRIAQSNVKHVPAQKARPGAPVAGQTRPGRIGHESGRTLPAIEA